MNPEDKTRVGSLRERVERLKIESAHLNIHIQELSENDETKNTRIQRLEHELESYKSLHLNLTRSLEQSKETARTLKDDKDKLFLTVANLSQRIGQQNKLPEESPNVWSKLPAAFRELKRLDDETIRIKAIQESSESDTEKDNLAKLMSQLAKQLEEIELLRSENVSRHRSFNDTNARFAKSECTSEEVSHLKYQIRKLSGIDKVRSARIAELEADLTKSRSSEMKLLQQSQRLQESFNLLHARNISLTEDFELQTKQFLSAQTAWKKVPAAIRSLKRLDDETVKLRKDTACPREQNSDDNYAKVVGGMRKENERLLEHIRSLKLENESERELARNAEKALERLKLTSSATIATLIEKLGETKIKEVLAKGIGVN